MSNNLRLSRESQLRMSLDSEAMVQSNKYSVFNPKLLVTNGSRKRVSEFKEVLIEDSSASSNSLIQSEDSKKHPHKTSDHQELVTKI